VGSSLHQFQGEIISEVCADMVDVSEMTIVLADLDFKKTTFTKLLT